MIGFALVHGGHGGAWNWDSVVPLLDAPSVVVDLPGRGGVVVGGESLSFRSCAQAVLDAADDAGVDRVVAVAHSMGGLTISALADAAPARIAHLIYLAALVPAAGTTVFDLYFTSRGAEPPEYADGIVPVAPIAAVRERLFGDLDEATLQRVYSRLVAEPVSLFRDPAATPPASIARTYVRCAHDTPVPPPMAAEFIERLGESTRVHDLDAGHGLIYTHPDVVAAILNEALAA